MTKNDACSYIATSKCKAPTVDIGEVDNKETDKDQEIYDITYLEYSMVSGGSDLTDKTLEVEASGKVDSTDMLGGTMFDVLWKNADEVTDSVPAEFFI